MNAWKRLMEQDAARGDVHEKKYEEEKRAAEERVQPLERIASDDDEFLVCQPKKNLGKEEKQKIVNSVKLTKALVLLGYNCWSQLEPGKTF